MVLLVVSNSFNVVKNLKKPDPVARQMPPFNTVYSRQRFVCWLYGMHFWTIPHLTFG